MTIIGVIELALAVLFFRRVMPVAMETGRVAALRVGCFSIAFLCWGGTALVVGLGFPWEADVVWIGHGAMICGGALWLGKLSGSDVKGWVDIGRAHRARKGGA